VEKTRRSNRPRFVAAALVIAAVGGIALYSVAHRGPDGPPQKDTVIGKAERDEAIENATRMLADHYVFPERASAMTQALHARMQHGEFDRITSAAAFADALTGALQADGNDRHLAVRYFEQPVVEPKEGDADSAAESLHQLRLNYGMATVQRLHGNIGYIDVHAFGRPQAAAPRIAAAMSLLQDTRALIIDLRRCSGGDPDTVMLFASYLFDTPTHLNDIYWRDENRTESRWTTATVEGTRYGQSRRVYILTSEDTFSGGEDFAYAMKYSGRATLVGETTGGGAHAGNPHRIGTHFMLFVPSGRPINPVTHTDWEGVGVEPDLKTSAKNALDRAQIEILTGLIAEEHDPEWKQRLEETLADLK